MAAFNPYDRKPSRNASPTAAQPYGANPQPVPAHAAGGVELPARYVDAAEQVIKEMSELNKNSSMIPISTTKLRKMFGLFIGMYNEIKRSNDDSLNEDQLQILTSARVRIVYECGRDKKSDRPRNEFDNIVEYFVKKSKLLEYLKSIGSSGKKFVDFYHYFEAVVAYHRFYFGEVKDKGQ